MIVKFGPIPIHGGCACVFLRRGWIDRRWVPHAVRNRYSIDGDHLRISIRKS